MGFLRGSGVVVVSVLLFICLLLGGIFLTLSWSLKYENVQEKLTPFISDLAEEQIEVAGGDINLTEEMDRAQEFMEEYCQNETEYVFSQGGQTFVIPCDVLEEIPEDPEAILTQGIEEMVEGVYYQEYDCSFWDCFGESEIPLFLVSEKAKDYWKGNFYFALIAALVLMVLLFFLVVNKPTMPIIVGALFIFSSLVFLQAESFVGNLAGEYSALVEIFFGSAGSVFWIMFILGLVILGAGIAWRIFGADSIKKKLSKKDVRKIASKKK